MRPSLAIIGSLPLLLLLLLLSPTVIASSNATSSTSTTTAAVVADPQDPERKHNSGTNNDYCEDYRQRQRRRTQLEDRDEGPGGENYIYGSASSEPIDDSNIEIAVGLWLNNRTAALERFGFIQFWDVLGVTSMRNLFRDATAFNDNIAAWNVDCVTNFHGMFWGYVSLFIICSVFVIRFMYLFLCSTVHCKQSTINRFLP